MIKMIRETDVETIERIIKDGVCCGDDYCKCKEKREFLLRMLNDARNTTIKTDYMKSMLHICSKNATRVTNEPDYAKGILVGAVSTIMAIKSATFEEAVEFIQEFLPRDFDETVIPDSWKTEFKKHETKRTNDYEEKEIIECKEIITKLLVKRSELLKDYNDLKRQNAKNEKLLEDIKAVLK